MPPITTARMASSSIHRPALLPSALETFELIISPATPAHRAANAYTMMMIPRARMPASRLASALPPTDSISMPSASRRVRNAVIATATTMRMPNGRVSQ